MRKKLKIWSICLILTMDSARRFLTVWWGKKLKLKINLETFNKKWNLMKKLLPRKIIRSSILKTKLHWNCHISKIFKENWRRKTRKIRPWWNKKNMPMNLARLLRAKLNNWNRKWIFLIKSCKKQTKRIKSFNLT